MITESTNRSVYIRGGRGILRVPKSRNFLRNSGRRGLARIQASRSTMVCVDDCGVERVGAAKVVGVEQQQRRAQDLLVKGEAEEVPGGALDKLHLLLGRGQG